MTMPIGRAGGYIGTCLSYLCELLVGSLKARLTSLHYINSLGTPGHLLCWKSGQMANLQITIACREFDN